MMVVDFSDLKDMAWWAYVLAGFCIGLYAHNHMTRHWVHLLIVRLLQGFIWIFQRTDPRYKSPKPEPATPKPDKPMPVKGNRRDGIEVEPAELERWLEKNPDLTVERR